MIVALISMEKLFDQAVTQVPALAVLCFVVVTFLKAQKERDQFIGTLHAEHMAARRDGQSAILENTVSNREVTRALQSLQEVMRNNQPERRR